jgi:hypothetical protein
MNPRDSTRLTGTWSATGEADSANPVKKLNSAIFR